MNHSKNLWQDEGSQDGLNLFGFFATTEADRTETVMMNFEDNNSDTSARANDVMCMDVDTLSGVEMVGIPKFYAYASAMKCHVTLPFTEFYKLRPDSDALVDSYLFGVFISSISPADMNTPKLKEDEDKLLMDREDEFGGVFRLMRATLIEFFNDTPKIGIKFEPLKCGAKWLATLVKRNPVMTVYFSLDRSEYAALMQLNNEPIKAWMLTFSREVVGAYITELQPSSTNAGAHNDLTWLLSMKSSSEAPSFTDRAYFSAKFDFMTSRNGTPVDLSFIQNGTATLADKIEKNPALIDIMPQSTKPTKMQVDSVSKGDENQILRSLTLNSDTKEPSVPAKPSRKRKLSATDEKPSDESTTNPGSDDIEVGTLARSFGSLYTTEIGTFLVNSGKTKKIDPSNDPNAISQIKRKTKLAEDIDPYITDSVQDTVLENGKKCILFSGVTLGEVGEERVQKELYFKSIFASTLSTKPKLSKKRDRLRHEIPMAWKRFIQECVLSSKLPPHPLITVPASAYTFGTQMYIRFITTLRENIVDPFIKEFTLSDVLNHGPKTFESCGITVDPTDKENPLRLAWDSVSATDNTYSGTDHSIARRCIFGKTALDNKPHFVLKTSNARPQCRVCVENLLQTQTIGGVVSAMLMFDAVLPLLINAHISSLMDKHFLAVGLPAIAGRVEEIKEEVEHSRAPVFQGTSSTVPPLDIVLLNSNRKYELACLEFFKKFISCGELLDAQNYGGATTTTTTTLTTTTTTPPTKHVQQPAGVSDIEGLSKIIFGKITTSITMLGGIRGRFIQKGKESKDV